MPPFVLLQVRDEKARSLESIAEAWNGDQEEAMRARDLEDLISECRTLPIGARKIWDRVKLDLASCDDVDTETVGETLRRVFNLCTRVCETVSLVATRVGRKRYTLAGAAELEAELAAFRRLANRIMDARPWDSEPAPRPDPEMLAEFRDCWEKGEYDSSEELLQQARSVNRPEKM
jgi:hypothetical protein